MIDRLRTNWKLLVCWNGRKHELAELIAEFGPVVGRKIYGSRRELVGYILTGRGWMG